MQGEVKVEGFEDLFKQMDELAEEIGKAKTERIWKKALSEAFQPVLLDAKQNAPVDTGQLADHIYMKVQKPQARDKASQTYQGETIMARVSVGAKRDDSTAHTIITKKGKEKTYYTNRPVALAQEFGTANEAARPFIRPALEKNAHNVIERLGKSIWYELTWGKYAKE